MNAHPFIRNIAKLLLVCLVASVALGVAQAALAASTIFTVNTRADAVDASPGDGECATSTGDCSLRAAIQEANALAGHDVIILPANPYSTTYALTIPGTNENQSATGDLDVRDNLTILGAGPMVTVISYDTNGHDADRLLQNHYANTTISGVRFSSGNFSPGVGGGINNRGTLTLENSEVINGGTREKGGGIYNSGTLTLKNVKVSDNEVDSYWALAWGGGIFNTGTLNVYNSTFSGNSTYVTEPDEITSQGGAIYNRGTATIFRSIFSGNHAESGPYNMGDVSGGAIYNRGTLTIRESRLTNNSAHTGGGLATFGALSRVTLEDSTVSGNGNGAYHGGGVYNGGSLLVIRASTFANNYGSWGGGLANDGWAIVINSTFSGNTAGQGGGIYNFGLIGSRKLSLHNVTITANTASGGGGGVYSDSATSLRLQNTAIAGNNDSDSPDCYGTLNSLGYNLVGDNTNCDLIPGVGDQ
ncbi:MAG: CSLREA domain-containing protein, partial [Chloroflexota bacterium]